MKRESRPMRRPIHLTLACLAAGSCLAAPPVEVPFELSGNYAFVEVLVRGRAMSFVFDTAAQGTAVNSRSARESGIEGTVTAIAVGTGGAIEVPLAPDLTLGVGALRIRDVDLALVSLDHLEEVLGRPIDGIIGADLLRGRVVLVDYDRQVLEVHDRRSFPFETWGEPCLLGGVLGQQWVEAEVELLAGETIQGQFVIDSGAGRYLELAAPFARKHDLLTRVGPSYSVPARGLTSATLDQRIGHVRSLRFCGREIPGPTAASTGARLPVGLSRASAGTMSRTSLSGLIGNGILKRFNTVFDASRNRMFLSPNRNRVTPIRSDASGLVLARPARGLVRVAEIVAGSPAAEAGIRKGDQVRAIDGEMAGAMSLEALREKLRRVGEVRWLELERDGSAFAVELKLRGLGSE